jgi:cation transport ATPase
LLALAAAVEKDSEHPLAEAIVRRNLRPEIAALSISGSSLLVAVNALPQKRLNLPAANLAGEQG